MRYLTVKEAEAFSATSDAFSYKILLEFIESRIKDYDEAIETPPLDLAGMVRQQQAIGARTELRKILDDHLHHLKTKSE